MKWDLVHLHILDGDSNQTASESMIVNSYLMAFVGNAIKTI